MINLRIVLFFLGILITSLGLAMILPLLVEIKFSKINNFKLSIVIPAFNESKIILQNNLIPPV